MSKQRRDQQSPSDTASGKTAGASDASGTRQDVDPAQPEPRQETNPSKPDVTPDKAGEPAKQAEATTPAASSHGDRSASTPTDTKKPETTKPASAKSGTAKSETTSSASKPSTKTPGQAKAATSAGTSNSGAKPGTGGTPPSGSKPTGSGRGKGGKLGLIALILVILLALAAAAAGYRGWQMLQQQQARLSQVDDNRSALDELESRLSDLDSNRQHTLNMMRGEFDQYRENLDSTLDKVLDELAQEQQADPREWLHAEAEYLLRLANQRLQLERDVKGAKALLNAADSRLREADNPALVPVRRAIQSELAALDSVPEIDRTGLYLALMAQQEQLARLPLKQEVDEIAAGEGETRPSGGWRDQLATLGRELKDLVTVRRHDQPLEALITPEQESYLRQNVRLLLEQAQLALLKSEPELYQASLDKARELVEGYYAADNEGVQRSLSRLESLRETNVRPSLPDISESSQRLKRFIEQRFGNGGSNGSGAQNGSAQGEGE
ncbi:uroporphyrinogen-III C-methyltransferase [Salinicola avicenniae]|uniref:uroporphyrinogen-III C-methyltransferase n=1 Tax=Salinicola avicenniae TaxID=2916836 RepID=UPI002073FC1D|nr:MULTISPECIES: uroporphyrinogen-III C-methyltransferase [unclassified Salinicola]